MDTVTIDGVEYVKANVLAKKHNYTTDYIGQLCRGKKVDARLVGRTWYVYPPSLDGHKTTRYSELRSGEKSINKAIIKSSSRRDVMSPVAKNTIKLQSTHFENRVFWKNPKYQGDSSDLLPELTKPATAVQKMNIQMADSERIRVTNVSKNITMISQPMPAVALAGTLKVLNYAPTFDEVSEAVDDDNTSEKYSHNDSPDEPESPLNDHERARGAAPNSTLLDVDHTTKKTVIPKKATYPVAFKRERTSEHLVASFSPKRTKEPLALSKQLPPKPASDSKESSLFFRLVVAPAVILLTVVVASALFVLESVTSVGSSGEEVASWRFNTASVGTFFGPK